MEESLSVIQLAVRFERSVATIYNWVKKGCPHTTTEQGKIMFDPDFVKKWHDENIHLDHMVKLGEK